MSDRVKNCERKAAECEREALLVTEERLRNVYVELAQHWHEMAHHRAILDLMQWANSSGLTAGCHCVKESASTGKTA